MNSDALIIGVGNRMRRDDGVGLNVAEQIAQFACGQVSIARVEGECYSLLELWPGIENVYLVDALRGPQPGSIIRIDASHEQLPVGLFGTSSHGFGVAQAVELSRAMKKLPKRLVIYGIAGEEFAEGEGLSLTVRHAAQEVALRIVDELPTCSC